MGEVVAVPRLGHLRGCEPVGADDLARPADLDELSVDILTDLHPLAEAAHGDQTVMVLAALTGLMATATFDDERMAAAADAADSSAVDLGEWLVARGMPFHSAYVLVASLVRDAAERHVPLAELVDSHPDLASSCSNPAPPSAAAPPPAGPAPARWPASLSATGTCSTRRRSGSAACSKRRSDALPLRPKGPDVFRLGMAGGRHGAEPVEEGRRVLLLHLLVEHLLAKPTKGRVRGCPPAGRCPGEPAAGDVAEGEAPPETILKRHNRAVRLDHERCNELSEPVVVRGRLGCEPARWVGAQDRTAGDVEMNAHTIAVEGLQPRTLQECVRQLALVGRRSCEFGARSPNLLHGMYLDKAGPVGDCQFDDRLQLVEVALGEREDDPEWNAGLGQRAETTLHTGIRMLRCAKAVMGLLDAIDAHCEEVDEIDEASEPGGSEGHAVCRDRRCHCRRLGAYEDVLEPAVQEWLAAGNADRVVSLVAEVAQCA